MRNVETQAKIAKCRRCHRPLRSSISVALGIGPRCAAIEAAFAPLSDKQRDKARQLMVDGGITRTNHPGIARVPAEGTGETYLCSVTGHCTCAFGMRRKDAGKTCYHVPVVRLEFRPRLTPARHSFILAA